MKFLKKQSKEIEELRQENLYLKKVAKDAISEIEKYHDMMVNFIDRTDSILDMVEEKTGRIE
tara:strand:+ start:17414 stop:17599 length:186 start_codon:yes stop_codon:yes gene_type:complete